MTSEIRTCKNCRSEFTIEPDDFSYYEKIQVPPPGLCPFCRAQQRLIFRNERVFYKRPCARCNKETISIYSPNKPFTVWCSECWFKFDWDAREFGIDYNPNKPFFEQWEEVWDKVPKAALLYNSSVNCEYTNLCTENKNCYMVIQSSNNENCTHCYWVQKCKDCLDTSFASETELSYESDDCYNCYKLFYSKGCHDSRDSFFLFDCKNCSNCIGCVNLRNKQYHVFNQPLTKEKYEEFLKEARLDTNAGVEAIREKFENFLTTQPRRFAEIISSENSTGNYIKNAKNCLQCFHCYDDVENNKYGVHIFRGAKDCYDCDVAGRNGELIYNSLTCGLDSSKIIACNRCFSSTNLEYCTYSLSSNNCLGCDGLVRKEYCILNKQYTKEEYLSLIGEIRKKIDQEIGYGNFFPKELTPFGYNETLAVENFPLTKEEALKQGFKWEDLSRGTFGKETIKWENAPDSIKDTEGIDVPKQIFACQSCNKNYLIIPREFEFYKQLQIPLPRLCPDCRHNRRFKARGPNRTWTRKCMCDYKVFDNTLKHTHHPDGQCPNQFETAYSPDRPEIIYCESCYNSEVA